MNPRWLAAGAVLAVAFACHRRDGGDEPKFDPTTLRADGGDFTRAELLTAHGECALATYRAASEKASSLVAALDAGGDGKAAFAETMAAFERAELMQFGPFAKAVGPGGEGIRDELYTWPLFDRCRVEKALVAKTYEAPEFRTQKIHAAERGLDTLEVLLHDGARLTCGDTLDAAELEARRKAYARIVAADVAARFAELVQRWEPAGRNFLGEMSTAGAGSRVFTSQVIALNSVMDAVFYVDAELKNDKIQKALGVDPAQAGFEAPYSRLGRAHVANNLAGFRALFFGCDDGEGLGFDDLLVAVGAGRVATSVRETFGQIEAALAGIPDGRLEEALTANTNEVRALLEALKKLAGILKTEVVTVLNLELPSRVEGDND